MCYNADMRTKKNYYNTTNPDLPKDNIPRIGIIFYALGMVTVYTDGKEWRGHYRWWHPLSMLIFIVAGFCCIFSDLSVQELLRDFFFYEYHWKQRKKKGELEYEK